METRSVTESNSFRERLDDFFNKIGRRVNGKAVMLFFVTPSGMMLPGVWVGTVLSLTLEVDKKTYLTGFIPDALLLVRVSSGMIDA